MRIPNQLIKAINNNNCILFVGSGLSLRVFSNNGKKYPQWDELIIYLNEWAFENDFINDTEKKLITDIINKNNLLVAAQILKRKMTKTDLASFFDITFRNDNKYDLVHKLILDIDFPYYLTSNYDSLIESAYFDYYATSLPTYTHDQLSLVNACISKNTKMLFKIHGTFDRVDTVILSNEDYRNLYNNSAYIEILKSIFLNKTVLFVGFGYNDPGISYILNSLSQDFKNENHLHYLLSEEGKYNSLEIEQLKEFERISVIEYSNEDGLHQNVDEFFKILAYECKKKPI